MRTLHRCFVIFVGIWVLLPTRLRADGGDCFIRCTIAGETISLTERVTASLDAEAALVLLAIGHHPPMSSLTIKVPKAGKGVHRSGSVPELALHYSRSVYSSSMNDHYSAGASAEGSWLRVRIERWGGVGEMTEGTFEGEAQTATGKKVKISKGRFRALLSPSGR